MSTTYQRPFVATLDQRFKAELPLIQVLAGPRQVGKTTGVRQLLAQGSWPHHYANADDVLVSDRNWLLEHWQKALLLGDGALLVIDEIQKVANWPETVKALWDAQPGRLRVLLLGSSALQIQAGVTESLAGRFELLRVHHWTFAELQAAFGYDLPRYLALGGYPGAVALEHDPDRWYAYMLDAIVEAVIGKDILQSHKVANPALFRQAFQILCAYPAQEISYTKLLGQLQDKGNTDLIKHYIDLYGGAFLLHALQKYSPKAWLARSSSPKMLPACPALYSMAAGVNVVQNAEQRGRAFELAVVRQFISLLVVQAPPGSKGFKGFDQFALGAGWRKHRPHGRDLLAMSLENIVSQWLMGEGRIGQGHDRPAIDRSVARARRVPFGQECVCCPL